MHRRLKCQVIFERALRTNTGLTRDGSDVIDLMAGNILNGTATPVQVKTARNAKKNKYWEWSVGRKPLTLKNSRLVYVFIDLKEDKSSNDVPTVFIVPVADVAAQAISAGFGENPDWKTFYFKINTDVATEYLDNWSLILYVLKALAHLKIVRALVIEILTKTTERQDMKNKKMTWEKMKKKYPDEWLLIIEYDSDESGHLLSGIVARHSPEKDEVYRLPGIDQSSAFKYTGKSTFPGGWRARAEHHNV